MSSITGYGSINGVVNSTSNMSLAILLPPNGTKRVFNISAGYSLRRGGTNTKLIQGRLLVVGTKFDTPTAFIDPVQAELTTVLGAAKIYFDVPIGIKSLNNTVIQESFDWLNGLVLPDGVDISIILTACFGDGSAPPAAADVNAYLNVSGVASGSDKIFKNA